LIKRIKDVETKWQYNLHKNITENDNETQYEFHNFIKENHISNESARYEFCAMRNHEKNNDMVIEFDTSSMNVKSESYSTLYELKNIDKDKDNTNNVSVIVFGFSVL